MFKSTTSCLKVLLPVFTLLHPSSTSWRTDDMVSSVQQLQVGYHGDSFWSIRYQAEAELLSCHLACWELHPRLPPPSLSLSVISPSVRLLIFFLSQIAPPPILPQRAGYESRWIVGNKSRTLQVLVINSVKWTWIIISLQTSDRKRKIWISFKLSNHQQNIVFTYWLLTRYPDIYLPLKTHLSLTPHRLND